MKLFRNAALSLLIFILPLIPAQTTIATSTFQKEKRTSDKGIYVTYWVAKTPSFFNRILAGAKASGINTLVIDAKEVLERPLIELVKNHKINSETKMTSEAWLVNLAERLHKEGFILTARIVTFKDDHLVITRPDLGVMEGKGLYRDRKGGRWADPYSNEVRLYNALIAERAAMSGVDEIQFDYIRFPAEGTANSAYYPHEIEDQSKVDTICLFLSSVKDRVKKYNVSIAVDIFGVTAWQSKNDIANLGQDLKRMSEYIDVLSPMFYPSHFHGGYDGYANPGSYPYYFVNEGIKKTQEILSDEAVSIIPWLQGFNMKSPNYGPGYIKEQVKACNDAGIDNYLVWNARNVYDIPFAALK